ncbi:DUF234 domain-containing protein, partial [Campylobacter sp. FMV-PI01]|nr:DUF234 domain-containing protein [Campylobacter portucalensis]
MKEFEIYSFKSSFDRFNHLEIDDIFKFHIIFDDLKLNDKHNDIFMAIKTEILYKFKEISKRFEFDSDTKKALIKLAKSDRKKFGVNKILPRYKAQKIINELLETGFLELELSREKKPTPLRKNEKLPKHLRRYVVHNKINFKSHFARFWFRFIEPNLKLLEAKEFEAVLEKIKHNFDNYS